MKKLLENLLGKLLCQKMGRIPDFLKRRWLEADLLYPIKQLLNPFHHKGGHLGQCKYFWSIAFKVPVHAARFYCIIK